jgi:predicted dehydrogenase
MIRVMLAGHGVRGRQWAAALRGDPRTELAGVADANPAILDGLDVPTFATLEAALEAVPTDAVILATPPDVHSHDVKVSSARGFPVLCEKPLTEDIDEAIDLVETVDRNGTLLLVGMNFRFIPSSRELRRLVETREYGNAMFGQFTYIWNRDGRRPDLNDYPLTMAQPMLLEQSIHHLDLMRYVYAREVLSVSADTWNPETSVYRDDSCVTALLRFEGGLHVAYFGTWTAGTSRFDYRWRTDFASGVMVQRQQFGAVYTARLVAENAMLGPMFTADAEPLQETPGTGSPPFVMDTEHLLNHFIAAIEGTERPGPSGRDHLATLALVHACIEAGATGRTVDIAGFARQRGIRFAS